MNKNNSIIIPKVNGMDITIELYRKTAEGKTEKAEITIRELLEKYSFIQQLSDVIFTANLVETFDTSDIKDEVDGKSRRTYITQGAPRIKINDAMAALVKKARINAGLTQNAACEAIGVSGAFANIVEKAKGDCNEEKLEQYCQVIGLDFEEVLALQ